MTKDIFFKSRVSPFRDRFEFEETYDWLFSSNNNIEKVYEALNIWKLRLAENTPTGVLCTLEIIEAQIHDSKVKSKSDQFDVIGSYSNAITRFFNFLTSLKHDTDKDVGGMRSVAKAIGIPDYVIELRVAISHTKQTPSLEVLRRAANHGLEFIKRKYWDIELAHIREAQLDPAKVRKLPVTSQEKQPTKLDKRNLQLQQKNKQLLELQLAIYDFVVELGQKYEVKKNKDLAGKHFILPAAQLETMQSYFNGKKLAKEDNLLAHYEDIIIDDIEATLQLCNDDGADLTEAILTRCGFFKEVAVKAQKQTSRESQSVAKAYSKLFDMLHRRNHLYVFVEKLFVACETEKSPLAECYWLHVIVNSLLLHANKTCDSIPTTNRDQIDLDKSLAGIGFSAEFVAFHIGCINQFTKSAALMCTKLMNPPISVEKAEMIEKLVAIYYDPPNLEMSLDDESFYTVQHFLEQMHSHLTQLKSPSAVKLAGHKRKLGVWQSADNNPLIDWKKMALGCEITG